VKHSTESAPTAKFKNRLARLFRQDLKTELVAQEPIEAQTQTAAAAEAHTPSEKETQTSSVHKVAERAKRVRRPARTSDTLPS
jgi:hypothetical protein